MWTEGENEQEKLPFSKKCLDTLRLSYVPEIPLLGLGRYSNL